tara:strand:- start:202 stop:543 length:342 start_codon:yes stop_codon:yes gene_type:complete
MTFEHNIKNWVTIDNQIKNLNEKLKDLREQRSDLQEQIMIEVDTSNLSQATINISDGSLKFTNSNYTKPLTIKFVEGCLNDVISTKEDVNKIMKYIKSKRETSTSKEIKRYYK